ncbi:PEP/pyruvate-binding domain-containing protein [Kitasatospora sp. NPDC059577]|uniref:PEP/pyruvate-binding domain-containing protein n=1 Tax=Kitasatospora sp. NPDC059577 TaxID=3346873 RepID=UPI0036CAA7B3
MTATALPALDHALTTQVAGAKAAALARLVAAGLPVPPGIVIPVGHPDEHLEAAAAEILARCPAPHGLIARSSAVAEDGATASFAGLFTSRISTAEPTALLDAVRAVRASAHHPTVIAYSQALAAPVLPAIAVLVQPALRPACSGVLAAEVTNSRCTRWRIEAVRGLAEPLVSGTQTGEIHTSGPGPRPTVRSTTQETIQLPGCPADLTTPPGEWVDLDPATGTRAKILTSVAGVLHLHTPATLAEEPVLTPQAREQLLATAARAAAALDLDHVDVEWVITADGTLHLVQARPLTAPLTDHTTSQTGSTDGQVLHGIAAAPGRGTGPTTLLTSADNPAIADQVLLCHTLGPEAVPALLTGPAAVVAGTGGELSHTAIITRELGIPCVTNVTAALTDLAPGTVVEVDGGAGTVRPAPAVPAQRVARAHSLATTGVLARILAGTEPADGRAATILLHGPNGPAPASLTAGTGRAHPIGVLIPGDLAVPPTVPDSCQMIDLPGLGVLLWPTQAPPPPKTIAVLGPEGQILHQRAVPHADRRAAP